MIEKETDGSDQAKIASVIYNRLDNPTSETAGYLNIDATILYATGGTEADLNADTPYNTRIHKGLTPTAIASPGVRCAEGPRCTPTPPGTTSMPWGTTESTTSSPPTGNSRTLSPQRSGIKMAEKTIELLSPAGDMERLRMSLAYGADAVYLAGPDFGMRSFAGNFTPEELRQAVELCHSRGVAVHVTCNTMPRNDEAARLPEWLEFLQAAGVDAAILADVGVLSLLKKHAPGVKAHISTQASVSNYQAAAAWYELGASRVILARELSLDEIREIRAKAPPALELEAFVHGAMCVSYSGRCLLSNYMTGRDANRGACAQPCRYQYALVEEKRPGEYFPIGEDAGGAFILNSRHMCMIDHVPELMDAGLDSLKIEGRAKSAYYAAIVTAAYRHAIDAARAGEPLDPVWRAEVDKVSHRPYSTGFYYGEPGQHTAHARYLRDWQVVGVVTSCAPDGAALCELRNKFAEGDELELVGPGVRPVSFRVEGLADGDGLPIPEARKPQMPFRLSLPVQAPPLSLLRRKAVGL